MNKNIFNPALIVHLYCVLLNLYYKTTFVVFLMSSKHLFRELLTEPNTISTDFCRCCWLHLDWVNHCICVDGAGDEGPGHKEVQYYWTRWHLEQEKLVTLVTTRSSGSSYMNHVELQNGCLTIELIVPSSFLLPFMDHVLRSLVKSMMAFFART